MKELPKNPDGSVMTIDDLAKDLISYLKQQELISENVASHMSYKSMAGYTHEYFVKNMGILAAMRGYEKERWEKIEAYLLDEKYKPLFGKNNKSEAKNGKNS